MEKEETECPSHADLVALENLLTTIKTLNTKALKERNNAHFYCTVDNDRAAQQYENARSKLRQIRDAIGVYLVNVSAPAGLRPAGAERTRRGTNITGDVRCTQCHFTPPKCDYDKAYLCIPFNPEVWDEWKCPACCP
jgi:hypothetical protein